MILSRKKNISGDIESSSPVRGFFDEGNGRRQIVSSFKSEAAGPAVFWRGGYGGKIKPQNPGENSESDSTSFHARISRKFRSWKV